MEEVLKSQVKGKNGDTEGEEVERGILSESWGDRGGREVSIN